MSRTTGLLIYEKLIEILCLKTVFKINIASLYCHGMLPISMLSLVSSMFLYGFSTCHIHLFLSRISML